LSFLIEHRNDENLVRFLQLSVDRRPTEELFDIRKDPGCLENLAENPKYVETKKKLMDRLMNYLKQTDDARVVDSDGGDIWETYPRYSGLRWFPTPGWAKKIPDSLPKQDWLEEKRPK